MKKIVPDPPPTSQHRAHVLSLRAATQAIRQALSEQPVTPLLAPLGPTVARPVGAHSLFSVCAGVSAEEALVHVSQLLKCAEEVCDEISEQGSGLEPGLVWSVTHSVEMARAVVLAVLDRTEMAATP